MICKQAVLLLLVLTGMPRLLPAQKVINLQCEHLINPLGIDNKTPRFSWAIDDPQAGAAQTSYRIVVSRDAGGEVWNSGIITSADNLVTYKGSPLQPFTRYTWKVLLTGKNNRPYDLSPTAFFETGMMQQTNWQGGWISDGSDIQRKPAPYFRKAFQLKKPVKTARVYIAAAGLYELSLNAAKVGNHRLDPMYTRFDRRNLYTTYDVSKQLQQGQNVIGVLLGNGWYNHQSTAVWYFDKAPWRNRPAFCLDLRVTYTDGSEETIYTDRSWRTALSPVIFNSIYTGEHYDAQLEIPGWDLPGFDDSKWATATDRAAPSQLIAAQALYPIRDVETIIPVDLKKFNDTNYVFNLGRNISGVSEIRVSGTAGTVIRLIHSERVHTSGHTDLSNINVHYRPTDDSDPFQTDIFILKGKGTETFKPRFNYKGFQYVEVISSKPVTLSKSSLQAWFMHSDVPQAGTIETGSPLINKIWQATNNAYLSNLFGYPTDCPQREKNGWTGDAVIALETGLYNFDGITVYEKWLADHRDEQQPNGVLPAIIPTSGWGYQWANGPDWTSTIAIIPWTLYQFYGDSKPLADNYENIKSYVNHIAALYPGGLTTWGLGDWVPVKSQSPVELTSSLYYYKDVTILAKTAALFNRKEDAARYQALAEKIKNAINGKYLNSATGIYGSGLQTEQSTPVYWGVVPEAVKARVVANLAKKVQEDGVQLDVGILGAKAVLNVLSENGYADLAYQLAARNTYPSWGWWIENGATTLYENWKVDAKNDASLNHIMFGDIGAWFYKALGGIFPDPKQPGFSNILLKPNFVTGLNAFKATYNSARGPILSSWEKQGDQLRYTCRIPANSTATFFTPAPWQPRKGYRMPGTPNKDGSYTLPSGTYTILLNKKY
ncbi:alpha-L-rhamnosidase [Niabella drilacis]|uniref:alpha-L-rhamnosidase n=1 Tax=Niabella drilacis (strain DSM 25811 / CCM 8410 / CCUG 62505 / LMG 26954 / E90) TaxID=1285928 RepID=A0A1G6NTM2_NIADE|nr:alpha-L-rhamnosidase [Niabella drilacis]SDC71273.1 alpha-L-rhamnosidase [Niabella drilacis]